MSRFKKLGGTVLGVYCFEGCLNLYTSKPSCPFAYLGVNDDELPITATIKTKDEKEKQGYKIW
ncbi:hypothetical protein GCM10023229_27280 [Flavisolibacter ginsenosidimutans]